MGFRFRKSFNILPGVRVNVGKNGASLSVGPRGAKLTIGPKGTRVTAGIPGTGLSYTEFMPHKSSRESKEPTTILEQNKKVSNKTLVSQHNRKNLVVPPNLPFYCRLWFIFALVALSFFTSFWLLIPAIVLFLRLGQLTDRYNKELKTNQTAPE